MSAGLPNCEVCKHRDADEVNAQMRGGTSVARISRFLRSRWARMLPVQREGSSLISSYQLREHLAVCFRELEGARANSKPKVKYIDPDAIPISVSAAELADPKRRLDLLREALSSKIGDLSARDLFQMYMAEMRLQTMQAERDAKSGALPEIEDDALDQAMAQAAGHLPDLRVVSKRPKAS